MKYIKKIKVDKNLNNSELSKVKQTVYVEKKIGLNSKQKEKNSK